MICSGFILGSRHTYTNFKWTSIKQKLKIKELDLDTIPILQEYVTNKYGLELVVVTNKHNATIKEYVFHINIPLPEHITVYDLMNQLQEIEEQNILQSFKKCLKFFGLTDQEPTLYSYAHRVTN